MVSLGQARAMSTIERTPLDLDPLRAACEGQVMTAVDPGWDDARRAFNLTVDQRPAAIVLAVGTADVVVAVRFARARGLRVAPQATGHNAGPLGDLSATILLKTSRMTGFEIDPSRRRARVRAGQKWAEVCDAASAHGLAPLSGSSRDVGVVGYTLGGGMGWLARSHGLAANAVVAAEIVLSDGRVVWTDAERESELFWAIRGGGGNFGIVTQLEFELFALSHLHAGILWFEFDRAAEVLQAWREWTADAPDQVTSVGRLLQFPPIPDVPEPVRGKSFAVVEVISTLDEAATAALVAPLRTLGPLMDTLEPAEPASLGFLHMDPDDPVPAVTGHTLTGPLPAAGIDRLMDVAGPGSGSALLSVELRHCGGALARVQEHHGAIARIDAEFAMFAIGVPMTPELGALQSVQIAQVEEALGPWASGRYLNFTEEAADTRTAFDPDTHARLQLARAAYDPEGVLLANHAIG